MHILIILNMGGVEFTKLCADGEMARMELADWCCDNWHDEDSSPEDFVTDEMIEWYFDNYEDYSYYRGPIGPAVTPAAAQAEMQDILLTPGMCAIIQNGLSKVANGRARDLLRDHDELNMGEDDNQQQQAMNTISQLKEQFE